MESDEQGYSCLETEDRENASKNGLMTAKVITEIDADMKALGKEKIMAENAKLRPIIENMLKRKQK
jgi:hypothetical protein